ncbi:uncharacterized protein LOC112574527 isoform X4 [Pomacea canaliculata]|uniref:uncharacterized protein LOC112574527 isoform X4 n=1 Tax=Pomacea canaliculata TaxID=400727 RepID=UPI000D738C9A|nr:uncharacterized protein LOC112574527 isoform X4 [Pomacea canaliculata]
MLEAVISLSFTPHTKLRPEQGCYEKDCYSLSITEPMASYLKATLFIFSLYRLSSAQDSSTTCDIPWVEPLANTSVTCHFPINVNQKNSIFGVSFESNDREKKIQDILDCGWFSGKTKCSTNRPGYKYNDIIRVSNTFSLEFPQASSEHIGRYTCHLVNIRPENFKPCEFRVKVVGKTMCLISSMESNTRTSLTCYYPEDLNKTRMNFTVYHYSRTGLTEVIMACEWKGDNLTCNTTHGYEFDGRVSDYLTLKIPMALESQEGAYSCHISDNGFLHYDNCTVTPEKNDAVTSTCHISSVEEAKPTALTCKFSVDVNMTKRNFTVVRLSDADRKAAVIANCTWLRDNLTCTTAFGYQFNNTVTDLVIISVPQASHNHSGTYACNVTGTVSSGFEPCEFLIMPDKSSVSGFITAAIVIVIVIVMCIPLSLIIVILALKKKASHINTRPCEEVEVASERTPMIPYQDGEMDQNPCGNLSDQDMVMIQEETVDTNQKPSQEQDVLGGHSPIQSDGHEEEINQTSLQSGLRDKDTQPLSNGDITGNDKTQDVLGSHSPIQSDGHEEMNQTSPQSGTRDKDTQPLSNGDHKRPLKSGARGDRMSVMSQQKKKGSRKKDVATDDNQAAEIADENTWVEMEIDKETTSYNHRQSGGMIPAASNQDDTSEVQCPHDRIFKILIIGASGSGKSTAGNILLGKDHFQVSNANPFIAESVAAMIGENDREDRHLLVLDTPDICSSEVNNDDKAKSELERWLNMCPDPHLILFTIRYSPADLNDAVRRFTRVKGLWDEDFIRQRLVVLFTFGDEKAPSEEELQNTSHAGLQEILDYAGHRYVIFDPTLRVSEQQKRVDQVLCYLDELTHFSLTPRRSLKIRSTVAADPGHDRSGMQKVCVLLVGKTGSGKSYLGNILLGSKFFKDTSGLFRYTQKCQHGEASFGGTKLTVIDTPGVCDIIDTENDIFKKILKEVATICSGPHVVIYVIACDRRFTLQDYYCFERLEKSFGENILPFLMIVFTGGDQLTDPGAEMTQALEKSITKSRKELKKMLEKVSNRYCVVGRGVSPEERNYHAKVVLDMILDSVVKPNAGAYFSSDLSIGMEELRIIILGKTGCGKSSLGNTLLSSKVFEEQTGINSMTSRSQFAGTHVNGKNVTVIDTPGLWDTRQREETALQEIFKTTVLCCPGPHVVIIVFRCDVRFTQEEYQSVKTLESFFGESIRPFLIIVFTAGDRLGATPDKMKQALDRQIEHAKEMKELLQHVSNRYCVVSNAGSPEQRKQSAKAVFDLILDNVIRPNEGKYFTNDMIKIMNKEVETIVLHLQKVFKVSKYEAIDIFRTRVICEGGTEIVKKLAAYVRLFARREAIKMMFRKFRCSIM